MRPGASLEGLPLALTKIERFAIRNPGPDQPSVWTTIQFEFPEEEAEQIAEALSGVIEERGGWYSHFNVSGESFVIYAHRVFRYPSGDKDGRAEAEAYGRSLGVPEAQLDWDEYE